MFFFPRLELLRHTISVEAYSINLQLIFLAANAMHPGSWLSPLLLYTGYVPKGAVPECRPAKCRPVRAECRPWLGEMPTGLNTHYSHYETVGLSSLCTVGRPSSLHRRRPPPYPIPKYRNSTLWLQKCTVQTAVTLVPGIAYLNLDPLSLRVSNNIL